MFLDKILNFDSYENIYWKFICLIEIWITWSQKELAKPQFLILKIYPLEKEITNSRDHFWSSNLELWISCTASPEYRNSGQNIIFLFWKYLNDIRSEAGLNLIWEHINGKLFAEFSPMLMISVIRENCETPQLKS